jgi:hypothetical protein
MPKFRTIIIVSLLLTTMGCGSRRPKWLGGRHESNVIQPTSTTPLPPSGTAPGGAPAPKALTPETGASSVGDVPGSSQTLSQTEPTLLGENASSPGDAPLSLTDLESLGGDLPWAGAKPDTLSDRIAQSGPRVEYVSQPQPRLAPLPEAKELDELEAWQEQETAETKRPPAAAPQTAEGSPDDLRDRMTAAGADDAPTTSPPPDVAPPVRKKVEEKQPETAEAPERKNIPFVEGQEEVIAGMTLQINDQNVTVDEILAALHKDLANIPKHVSRDKFRKMAAEIITREMWFEARSILMYAEAKRRLQDNVKEVIQHDMADIKREMIAEAGGSVEMLKEKCRREGTTLDDVLKGHERELTSRYYMRVKFGPAIIVNRRMLNNYYKKHQSDFVVDREVQMQIIAAPFRRFLDGETRNPTDEELAVAKTKARQAIDDAAAALKDGKDFGETAKTYSRGLRAKQGGVWEMMAAGNFRNTRVEKEAFTLPEGKCSGIIEGKDGYYIVKALKVKPGKITDFLDAQDMIETILRNEQYDKLSREYMNKLYENAVINSPPDFIPTAVQRALERYKGKG